jgi:serine/threonine protein kinase
LNLSNGEFVAIKELELTGKGVRSAMQSVGNNFDDDGDDSSPTTPRMQEIRILKRLNHPNVVQYVNCYQKRGYLYIVFEYVESGSLSDIVRRFGRFPEQLVMIYIQQVLKGLSYLHAKNIIHRDIKGASMFCARDRNAKKKKKKRKRRDNVED